MANIVHSLIQKTLHRARGLTPEATASMALSFINDEYLAAITECDFLKKSIAVPSGTFSESAYKYVLPDDFRKLSAVTKVNGDVRVMRYVPEDEWARPNVVNSNFFTINRDNDDGALQLELANVDAQTELVIRYSCAGLELVDAEDTDLTAGTTNTPQWPREFDRILILAAAMAINPQHPLVDIDYAVLTALRQRLRERTRNFQIVSPTQIGGTYDTDAYLQPRDTNDTLDGLWITRVRR
jgi:hypothetical protein